MQEIYTDKPRATRVWSLKKEQGKEWTGVFPTQQKQETTLSRIVDLWKGIPVFLLCLISSQGALTGGAMPFGAALLAAYMMRGKYVLFAGVGCALGLFMGGNLMQALCCACMLALFLLLAAFKVKLSDLAVILMAGIASFLFPLYLASTAFDVIMASITAILAMFLSRMYSTALSVKWKQRDLISTEEIACLCLLAAGPLMGLKGYLIYGVSPVICVMLLLCLFTGYLGGAGTGAAAGAMLGAMVGLSAPLQPHLAGGMALCGLLCGIFSGLGRFGVSGALLLGVILSASLSESWFAPEMFIQAGAAILLFMLLPKKFLLEALTRVRREARIKTDACTVENEVRTSLRQRLEKYSDLYYGMAQVITPKATGRQYAAMGQALGTMAAEFGRFVELDPNRARLVAEAFDRERLSHLGIRATTMGGEIRIAVQLRKHTTANTRDKMLKAASKALNLTLRVAPDEKDETNQLALCPATRYSILIGCAQAESAQGAPCGDNHIFAELPGDGYMLAISDGMGHGIKAYDESRAAIELLEDYLMAGFDPDAAVMGVNDILLRRARNEMFATMDLGLINLSTGRLKLMKVGAVDSYIKRGKQLITLRGGSLPMGIVENLSPMEGETQLMDGDVIILTSDGVPDASEDGENWLMQKLSSMQLRDPQAAAQQIVNEALDLTENPDDMTVLIARVFKRW